MAAESLDKDPPFLFNRPFTVQERNEWPYKKFCKNSNDERLEERVIKYGDPEETVM